MSKNNENVKMENEIKKIFSNARVIGTRPISVNLLHTNLPCQKYPSKSTLNKMKRVPFSLIICDALVVSFRDGKYNVIDGQHRLIYAKESKVDTLYCRIIVGLTEKEECELFDYLARRRTVTYQEKLKSRYDAGVKEVVEMVEDIESTGLIFDFQTSSKENRITAHSASMDLHSAMTRQNFRDFYSLIKATWNGKSVSLQEQHILGMYRFYTKYSKNYNKTNCFDEQSFIRILGGYSPEDIKKAVGNIKGDRFYKRYVEEIFDRYNKGTRKYKITE
jgi:hypothetical protein